MSVVLMAVLLAIAGTSAAATDAPATSDLLRLEDEFARGVVRRDAAVFQRLLAERFVYTENDRMMTREILITELTTGTDRVEAAANEDMVVHLFGDTALVTGWLVLRGRGDGGAFARRYRFTDTWQLRGTRWQLIGAHDSLAPEGSGQR